MYKKNGSTTRAMNRNDFRLNRQVDKTEKYLTDSYLETFPGSICSETSINNPLRRQKALAMDNDWKETLGIPRGSEDLFDEGWGYLVENEDE
jgi:hypothetical protein